VLGHYTVQYLDSLNLVVVCATLITYTIYTCSRDMSEKMYLTLPFVVYGLFRYLYLLQMNSHGGDPARTLVKDKYIAATVLLWGVTCMLILYGVV
jgi:4-hydroxybenzoate polyprenyltransferase